MKDCPEDSADIREMLESYYDVYFGVDAVYEQFAKLHGLTSSSLFILTMIYQHPKECTQHFICDKLFYPKQTVNTILDSFEKKGYIFKEKNVQDKRNKNVYLTEAGQQYADVILSDMRYLEETALTNMRPEERTAMLQGEQAFLIQLTQALSTLNKQGDLP
ncbi:MAG: MarR family transcriptional regulator [Lacrimispora sp.]